LSDGNRSREIFTHLTHSDVTFGTFGVDGFFLLSGYLIVRSWQLNPDLFSFLRNRVLRIFPGYRPEGSLLPPHPESETRATCVAHRGQPIRHSRHGRIGRFVTHQHRPRLE
jgi:hypothetical protein